MRMLLTDRPAGDPVDAVAVALYRRNYDRIFRSLRREFAQWPEDLCHDAIIDALEEIRRAGQYRSYSSTAEGDFVKRSRRRAVDRARRESGRRAIAPTGELREDLHADGDDLSKALEEMAATARLRELVLPLRPDEARFVFLTALVGLTRDEAAAKMGVQPARARRLVTTTHRRLVEFYTAVSDGSVHHEFACQLRIRLEQGDRASALQDPAIRTHLDWCEHCGELIGRMDRDLRAVAPVLALIGSAAAKGGILGAIFGGSAAGTGGGGLIGGGLTAGKTVAVVCAVGCTAGGAVVAEQAVIGKHPRKPPAKTQPAQAVVSRETPPTAPVVQRTPAPRATTRATTPSTPTAPRTAQTTKTRSVAKTVKRRSRPRNATTAEVNRLVGATRTTSTASVRSTSGASAPVNGPAASSGQVERSFGPTAASTPPPPARTAPPPPPPPAAAAKAPRCYPGDPGC